MKSTESLKKFRNMTSAELEKEYLQSNKDYQITILNIKAGKEKNISKINQKKLEISRLLTIINEKSNE